MFSLIGSFFLSFFPDADPQVMGAITSFGDAMTGGGLLTMNVFYFIDMQLVALFASMAIVAIAAAFVVRMVEMVMDFVHKVVDSVPAMLPVVPA